jgi:hypothetical protein
MWVINNGENGEARAAMLDLKAELRAVDALENGVRYH